MRLDRFLSQATGLTRSRAQRIIRSGEVRVDSMVVTDPGAHVTSSACVEYLGKAATVRPRYFMLHKPAGYVCATADREHRTVLELLDTPNPARLHVAGRLDMDATGLVLLSDDGAWSHRVTSPRYKFPKIYRVTLTEPLSEASAAALGRGVQLRSEPRRCAPANIERISDREARITVTTGKYHQVKRMFAAVGNKVVTLHRERIGAVVLDLALAPGESRTLTETEIASFTRAQV